MPQPLLPWFLLSLLTLLPTAQTQQTGTQRCQWATVRSATDAVLETISSGLAPASSDSVLSSPSILYTQNLVSLPSITSPGSLLSGATPLEVVFAHSIVDQDACAGFVKAVISVSNDTGTTDTTVGEGGGEGDEEVVSGYGETDGKGNGDAENRERDDAVAAGTYIVGTQVRFNYSAGTGATVYSLDLIFAGAAGDWKFPSSASSSSPSSPSFSSSSSSSPADRGGVNATELVGLLQRENWSSLSRMAQDNRTTLEGVAGKYLDYYLGGDGTQGVADAGEEIWGRPCSRLEGAVYTAVGDGESCGVARRGGQGVTERRFVVDESIGAVSVLARDGSLGGAPSAFEFRVVDGKLRYVHQVAATAVVTAEG